MAVQPRPRGDNQLDNAGALVTGADYRALGVIRSLGRRGIPVCVLKQGDHRLATTSRYVQHSWHWPTGEDSDRVNFLLKLAAEHNLHRWVLFPTDDETVCLVARHHAALAKQFRLTVPPWEQLRRVCDKRLLHQLAEDLNIDQPWTSCGLNHNELTRLDCPFPVILKPALREVFNRLTAEKAWRVDNRDALLERFDEACALVSRDLIMVQEIIPGGGEAQFSYAALCWEGRPLASLVARRTRQTPMDFGRSSTFVETIDEPGVVEPSLRLLNAIRYTGLVEVEFKRDWRDGQFKLLDLNPRVWGWHTVGNRAGVDFSYLLWLLMCGEPISETQAHPGVRWVRMSTDFPIAALEILRGRLSVRDYLHSLRGPIESAIFTIDDPLPGLLELPLIIYVLYKRICRTGSI
jgi:D-aspartate ligase